jgi:hypothetical protein
LAVEEVKKVVLWDVSFCFEIPRPFHRPGAGEEEAISSSSSRSLFRREVLLGPLLAADMLGLKGELGNISITTTNADLAQSLRIISYLMFNFTL